MTQPGYILVDLDHRGVEVVEAMRAEGLAPCVVLQTSPAIFRWMRVCTTPLEPAVASSIGKQLAAVTAEIWPGSEAVHPQAVISRTPP